MKMLLFLPSISRCLEQTRVSKNLSRHSPNSSTHLTYCQALQLGQGCLQLAHVGWEFFLWLFPRKKSTLETFFAFKLANAVCRCCWPVKTWIVLGTILFSAHRISCAHFKNFIHKMARDSSIFSRWSMKVPSIPTHKKLWEAKIRPNAPSFSSNSFESESFMIY